MTRNIDIIIWVLPAHSRNLSREAGSIATTSLAAAVVASDRPAAAAAVHTWPGVATIAYTRRSVA